MTETKVAIAESNVEQASEWDGAHGAYWAARAEDYERSTAAFVPHLIAAAEVRADSRVLDIGCGTGRLSRGAAALATRGRVLGVDLSGQMVAIARRRAAADGLTNVVFEQADAQIHPFPAATHNVALGQMSAMFFGDKDAALTNLRRTLKPGGRLVLLTWRTPAENPWFVSFTGALAAGRALPAPPPDGAHPFSLSDPERIRQSLERAEFTDIAIRHVDEPMNFGPTAEYAQDFMVGQFGWLLDGLDDADRRAAEAALLQTLREHTDDSGVTYPAAAWLTTAVRAQDRSANSPDGDLGHQALV